MKRTVDHSAMAVVGYTVPWYTPAGGRVHLHVSAESPIGPVRLVRLDTPDIATMGWPLGATAEPIARRSFDRGSRLVIAAAEIARLAPIDGLAFDLLPTRETTERVIVACDAFTLRFAAGDLILVDADGRVAAETRPPARLWLRVEIAAVAGCLGLTVTSLDRLTPFRFEEVSERPWRRPTAEVVFGAPLAGDLPGFDGRFAAIALTTAAGPVSWRFPTLMPEGPVLSVEPPHVVLEAIGLPTFCLPSARWDGTSFDPRLVPDHYDAVHTHADDMGPLDWPASHVVEVPETAAPGVYAFEVAHPAGSERFAFHVVSREVRAPLVVVMPTATHLAYADERLPPSLYPWLCEDRGQRFAADNDLRSLYDFHDDLSGVTLVSDRRPRATLREDYIYPLSASPHNLPVDLHLLRFLHRNGIAFDLVTDHDLDDRGFEALAGHAAVVTGSHPEYVSTRIDEALRRFLAAGGSLAYLGGNGFAGKVAFRGDLMELRRTPLEGFRTWDGPISEIALALTNEPGGPLRATGRGEFTLVGGAIALMGFDGARPFTRTPESRDAAVAWLFDGVAADTFGDEGIVLGGAAGYELDAIDERLGTSPETVVVARASGFSEKFVGDATRWYPGGEDERDAKRCAEMTLRPLRSGGWVFSASSVAWCGALPGEGMNDVGRITVNLLHRLADGRRVEADAGTDPVDATGW